MESRTGEETINLVASDKVPERCLWFFPAAVPEMEVNRRFILRGDAGSAVVQGCRRGGAPTESAVRASPTLCKQVTGSDSANELEALISIARYSDSLREVSLRAWLALGGAVLGFVVTVLGSIITFMTTAAPLGLLLAVAACACVLGAAKAVGAMKKALTIKCD